MRRRLAFARIEEGTSAHTQRSSRIRAPWVVSAAVDTKGEENKISSLSAKREQLTRERRDADKFLMKKEKQTEPKIDPC